VNIGALLANGSRLVVDPVATFKTLFDCPTVFPQRRPW
jgi:hypothetical protein